MHVVGIDEDRYVEYGKFAWAADGQRFIVDRHAEYEHDESVYSSDLWLYDLEGRRCRLTTTPRIEEYDAGWIDDRSIRFTLLDWNTRADTAATVHSARTSLIRHSLRAADSDSAGTGILVTAPAGG